MLFTAQPGWLPARVHAKVDRTCLPHPPACHCRWLDLFAGTGAVGIEALSRGVGECHFVEMSPWVVGNCLMPNLETCELESAAVVHTGVRAWPACAPTGGGKQQQQGAGVHACQHLRQCGATSQGADQCTPAARLLFLRRAATLTRFAGGPFDFMSGERPALLLAACMLQHWQQVAQAAARLPSPQLLLFLSPYPSVLTCPSVCFCCRSVPPLRAG